MSNVNNPEDLFLIDFGLSGIIESGKQRGICEGTFTFTLRYS